MRETVSGKATWSDIKAKRKTDFKIVIKNMSFQWMLLGIPASIKKIKSNFKTFSGDALIGTVRIHQILAAIHEIIIFERL